MALNFIGIDRFNSVGLLTKLKEANTLSHRSRPLWPPFGSKNPSKVALKFAVEGAQGDLGEVQQGLEVRATLEGVD